MAKCDICGETTLGPGTCSDCCERALDIGLAILKKQKNLQIRRL